MQPIGQGGWLVWQDRSRVGRQSDRRPVNYGWCGIANVQCWYMGVDATGLAGAAFSYPNE